MKKYLPLLPILAVCFITSCQKEAGFNINPNTSNSGKILAGNGGQGAVNGTGTGASFYNPTGLAVDTSGNVYVADYRNNMVRKITPAGVVTTWAGSGAQGAVNNNGVYASFYQPTGVAVNAAGNVYITDSNNNLIRKVDAAGDVTTLAGTGAKGFLNGATTAATFNYPEGIALDAAQNIYVTDYGNNLIREISPSNIVTTIAGNGNTGFNNGADTAATFNEPTGIAVDAAYNLYVADYGNNMIRKISAGGSVTTLAGSGVAGFTNGQGAAASFNGPTGIALDAAGNIYVTDYGNNAIREISPSGMVTTLGSGTGNSTKNYTFFHPYGIAIDAKGNIYIAVYGNNTIQKISR